MTNSANIIALETVANALGDLSDKMIFTGGTVVGLYSEKSTLSEPRVTNDVDSIVSTSTSLEFQKLEADLHTCGFINVGLLGEKGPICRYKYQDIILDVMPADSKVLGFTNHWFKYALKNPFQQKLPSGKIINLATFPRFLAIKIETFNDRGRGDIRNSHDLEDIVRLVDGRIDPIIELKQEVAIITNYLRNSAQQLLKLNIFREAVEASAPMGFEQAERVLKVLQELSEIEIT